jgi:hypothetical protein
MFDRWHDQAQDRSGSMGCTWPDALGGKDVLLWRVVSWTDFSRSFQLGINVVSVWVIIGFYYEWNLLADYENCSGCARSGVNLTRWRTNDWLRWEAYMCTCRSTIVLTLTMTRSAYELLNRNWKVMAHAGSRKGMIMKLFARMDADRELRRRILQISSTTRWVLQFSHLIVSLKCEDAVKYKMFQLSVM